jgi:MFS family permease
MAKNNFDPVGTLSIGNVVTTGTILYKSNFKRYFQVSLRATGWLLALVLSIVVATLIGGILYGLTQSWLVTIPVGIAWIGVTLYFSAKYATDRAIICRLAYQELIDAPETIAVATQQLSPRSWDFLKLSWLIGLYLCLVAIIGYIVLGLILIMAIAIVIYGLKMSIEDPNPFLILLFLLLIISLFLAWMAILVRFYASWFVAELPLAVEQTRSASFSVRRSQQLIKTATGRVILIITIAFLMALPINTVGSIPSFIGQVMSSASTDLATQSIGYALILSGLLLNLLSELFIMPFWQIIKAIIYYDLRNRREGIDLII